MESNSRRGRMITLVIILSFIIWALCGIIVFIEESFRSGMASAFGYGGTSNLTMLILILLSPLLLTLRVGAIIVFGIIDWAKR